MPAQGTSGGLADDGVTGEGTASPDDALAMNNVTEARVATEAAGGVDEVTGPPSSSFATEAGGYKLRLSPKTSTGYWCVYRSSHGSGYIAQVYSHGRQITLGHSVKAVEAAVLVAKWASGKAEPSAAASRTSIEPAVKVESSSQIEAEGYQLCKSIRNKSGYTGVYPTSNHST